MTEKDPKQAEKFHCEKCDFNTSKRRNYEKHLLTRKHQNNDKMMTNDDTEKSSLYLCDCGKVYRHRQGLHFHKKTCSQSQSSDTTPTENMIVVQHTDQNHISILTSMVMEIAKSNLDLQRQSVEAQRQIVETQKQFLDVCKNLQPSLNNNCHNTNNTNTFNMQVFLNEECKNAINLSDFVNSFEVQLEDLENVGKLGYTTGISNMIIKELKLLDVYKRPIHCSDPRREIFYVKENNIWERETPDNSTVKKAIQGVTRKNMTKLNVWREKYPECMDSDSAYNDIYLKLVHESCGGRGDTAMHDQKIFKNIMKEVLIKK
jgi:hypothetical protein